jgi:hypothetical protein
MAWQILFSITVQHDFFPATSGPLLDFVPTPETQGIIRSADLLIRTESNRIIICYDDEKEEILQYCISGSTGNLEFVFNVYAQDPQYELYTDMQGSLSGIPPGYSNLEKCISVENRLRLEAMNNAAAKELAERAAVQAGNTGYPVKQPIFNVSISLTKQDSLEHPEYFILCAARKTYWKYYLLGELAEQETELIDLRGEILFRCAGQQNPFPGRPATVFYSAEPVALKQRAAKQFQLRQGGSNGNKVLIKRLPNASVENLAQDTLKGEKVDVSEIYINY